MQGKLLDLAKSAALVATKAGAKDARTSVFRFREVRVEWRDGKLDRIRESTRQGLYVDLFVDGRYSSNSTSDIRDSAVEDYVRQTVDATRYLAADEHRNLPSPARYAGRTRVDLELKDPSLASVTPETRLSEARKLEQAARSTSGKAPILSVTSSVSDYEARGVVFATNGMEGEEETTRFSHSLQVTVEGADNRRPMGYAYASARHLADLPDAAELGPDAYERAAGQLGSSQLPTGDYEVIIETRSAGRFAYQLLGPIRGSAIQQRRSFLEDKLDKQVASPVLSIRDEPHLPRATGSTGFDNEGMATVPRTIFDKGVLKTFYLNTYYASKLGVEPTTGSFNNLIWGTGDRSLEQMIADVDEGILVTSFLGGNSNSTTGDFSVGIKGFFIKGGKVQHPVSEMNMAGNHLEVWTKLAEVGDDPWKYSSNRIPSLRFKEVQCSGSKA